MVFVDDDGVVCARRWCWRQSAHERHAARDTTEALLVVEGHHDAAGEDVAAASDALAALLAEHQPGAAVSASAYR